MSDNEVLEWAYFFILDLHDGDNTIHPLNRFKDIMMKYDKIHDDADFYRCLVEAGVDNWGGYDIAVDIYEEKYE